MVLLWTHYTYRVHSTHIANASSSIGWLVVHMVVRQLNRLWCHMVNEG